MTDTLTLDQLLAEWHLGDDSIGKHARKAVDTAGITPADAAALTPKELANIPGLGVARLARVREQLDLIAAAKARKDRAATLAAAKAKPGHCPDCGGLRATPATSSSTSAAPPAPPSSPTASSSTRASPATSGTGASSASAPQNWQEPEMPYELPSCGTTAAHARHQKLGESPCPPCKEARSRYERERSAKARSGRPASASRRSLRERLLSKAIIDLKTGCWNWTASTNGKGYGQLTVNGRMQKAHRVAFALIEGPIPDGLELDHLCRNRACINPAHLEPVTSRENTLRSPISPSAINSRKTHCPSGHEYTAENTLTRKGGRYCRICNREQCKQRRDLVATRAAELAAV